MTPSDDKAPSKWAPLHSDADICTRVIWRRHEYGAVTPPYYMQPMRTPRRMAQARQPHATAFVRATAALTASSAVATAALSPEIAASSCAYACPSASISAPQSEKRLTRASSWLTSSASALPSSAS
eukprot:CAMPEP_0181187584 /NCGR_PEP_ID=MMETSP1096-20121128/10651_1 /TAXON_ID=156174 ORGANISM="Chrysochromulina ericina, Strain CCMP281" /NCGR_SAMPLE_ID=MMETSP1096 /ASSEMBLY_ACC=CAM_ASM_000453 /LENGTH=125 /DNA_ID=CAMNT_0023276569 /DNA_START=299 /DNA_END=676 /DNA_ORIENTATION=-